jgi:hypothetical protein
MIDSRGSNIVCVETFTNSIQIIFTTNSRQISITKELLKITNAEHLPSKPKVLSSSPSTAKKNKSISILG